MAGNGLQVCELALASVLEEVAVQGAAHRGQASGRSRASLVRMILLHVYVNETFSPENLCTRKRLSVGCNARHGAPETIHASPHTLNVYIWMVNK